MNLLLMAAIFCEKEMHEDLDFIADVKLNTWHKKYLTKVINPKG